MGTKPEDIFPGIADGAVELVGAVAAVRLAVAPQVEADALAALAAELARGVAGVAGARFNRNFLA